MRVATTGVGSSQDYLQEWWQDAATQDAATPIMLTSGTPDVSGIDFTLDLGRHDHRYSGRGRRQLTAE